MTFDRDAAARKRSHHPGVGDLSLLHEVLQLGEDGQRLTVYQAPPGTADYDALTCCR